MRCAWRTDPEIGRFHVPGCMGAAVYGPRGCTCGTRSEKSLEDRMVDLESRISDLERRLDQ